MPQTDDSRIAIREGYYFLIIVQDEEVTHYTPDFGLSHVDFVKRKVGSLPEHGSDPPPRTTVGSRQ